MPADPPGLGAEALLAALHSEVVGLQREAEVLAVALQTGRHVVLEGPPGAGKSTLLRHLAGHAGRRVEFVEGNAELTPGRLVGQYDPALVLEGGYRPEAFLEGPLVAALRAGAWLYVEELNRVPEETLNVLITVLAEGELHVPRLGHVPAEPGFWLVAAMNPFDAVGTARVSQAVADRMCRIAIGYQDEAAERHIVERATGSAGDLVEVAVALARATREHPDLRNGASVRGAIDITLLATGLAGLRTEDPVGRGVLRDAALTALTGRIALQDGSPRTPEEVVEEILDGVLAARRDREAPASDGQEPERGPPPPGPSANEPPPQGEPPPPAEPPTPRPSLRGARTLGRHQLEARHPDFTGVSPEVGQLDSAAFDELLSRDATEAVELLHDLARATDPVLRALAHRIAARIFLGMVRAGSPVRTAVVRLRSEPGAEQGDLDLERTLERAGGRPKTREDLVLQGWGGSSRRLVLAIDHSGSMRGRALAVACVTTAAVALAAREDGGCGVVAFARVPRILQERGAPRSIDALVDDVLALDGGGTTDLAAALRAAAAQFGEDRGGRREVLLLSDGLATAGGDPAAALHGIERLHVLGTSDAPAAIAAGRELARRGNGRYALVESAAAVGRRVREVLG